MKPAWACLGLCRFFFYGKIWLGKGAAAHAAARGHDARAGPCQIKTKGVCDMSQLADRLVRIGYGPEQAERIILQYTGADALNALEAYIQAKESDMGGTGDGI